MAQIPNRSGIGLGILRGYASDAEFESACGLSPKRGDIYFNTTASRLRIHDGSGWTNLADIHFSTVGAIDISLSSIPSGPQAIDGILQNIGSHVLLAAHPSKGIYRVNAGIWTLVSELTNPDGSITTGDHVYVLAGSRFANTFWVFTGSNWVLSDEVKPGTVNNSTLHWNGTFWVENDTIFTGTRSISAPDDVAADAISAGDLTIHSSNKTAGTGSGGNLLLSAGTSFGGSTGKVSITGATIKIDALGTVDPSAVTGELYFNTNLNQFRYFDNSEWKGLGPLPSGTFNNSILHWNGTNWVENPILSISSGVISTESNSIDNPISTDSISIYSGNKTAGTGSGGAISIASGYSAGGTGGNINLSAGSSALALGGSIRIQSGSGVTQGSVLIDTLTLQKNSIGSMSLSTPDNAVADSSQASSISISSGSKTSGTGNGGDFSINTGTSVGGNKGVLSIDAYKMNLNLQLASDPSGVLGDVYYNTVEKRFRYFDGTIWLPLGSGGGLTKIDLYDMVDTFKPTGLDIDGNPVAVVIDGVTVTTGMLVLFANVSAPNNEVWKATVVGSSVSWTAQQLFNGSNIPTSGDIIVVKSGTAFANQIGTFTGSSWSFNKTVRHFNGVDYWEQSAIYTSAIADNTSLGTIFSVAAAGSENIIIDYSVLRGSAKETGVHIITTDGSTISSSGESAFTSDIGVVFTAVLSAGNILFKYTSDSNGSSGNIKYSIRRWSNTTGGTGGPPSYSGSGPVSSVAAGNNKNIQFNSAGFLAGNNNFNIDTSLGELQLGSYSIKIISTATIADNQSAPALLLSYSATSYPYSVFDYSVSRNGSHRVGRLFVVTDGIQVSVTDDFNEIGDCGFGWTGHVISGGNIQVKYISDTQGANGLFKYSQRRWT